MRCSRRREAIEAADAAARAAQQAGLLLTGRLRVGYPAAGVFELPLLALRTFREFPSVGSRWWSRRPGRIWRRW